MSFQDTAIRALATALSGPVGASILDEARRALGEAWSAFPDEGKRDLAWGAVELAKYHLVGLAGLGVEQEVLGLKSTIANWSWVGSDLAKKTLAEAAKNVLVGTATVALRALL